MKQIKQLIVALAFLFFPVATAFAAGNIAPSPASLSIEEGSTASFTITATNTIGDVTIVSGNPSVASVSASEWGTGMVEEGVTKSTTVVVTGHSAGTTTITLTLDAATFDGEDLAGQTRTVAVSVTPKPTPQPEPEPQPQPQPEPQPTPEPTPQPEEPEQPEQPQPENPATTESKEENELANTTTDATNTTNTTSNTTNNTTKIPNNNTTATVIAKKETPSFPFWVILAIGFAVIIVAVILFLFIKKRKSRPSITPVSQPDENQNSMEEKDQSGDFPRF